jgi:hypothetical protein
VVVLALLVLVAGEIFFSSRQESQVSDEADHLYAGYEYWKHGDFGRNPEHPPLAKLVAASALLGLGLSEPVDRADSRESFKYRDFYDGERFLYGADADQLLVRGRGMLLVFGLGLALAVFWAGREMFGPEAGLGAMALFSLEPVVLGNGGLILTDMTMSCLLFVSVVAFYRWVKRPGLGWLLACGGAAGLTLAAKQSGAFVLPILAVLGVADVGLEWSQAGASARKRVGPVAGALAVVAALSYLVLWGCYGFRYAARPDGLALTPGLQAYAAAIPNHLQAWAVDFFARHHLLPEAYLYGWADILQVPGRRDSFVLGKLHAGTWWLGFPAMLAMKTTIPLMVLLVLTPFAGVWRRRREVLFLAAPAAIYLLIAMASGMNAELRYVLPVYPFAMVLAGAAGWEMARRSRGWAIAAGALAAFAAGSSAHAFPDYLAYANEAFGGPGNSYRLMAGSNGDGGQGLKWVKRYLDENPASDCWFDYVDPFVDPRYYGIGCKPLVSESTLMGSPLLGQVPATISGVVLISATERAGRSWEPDALNPYAQFDRREPDAKPGNVVLAYRGTFAVPLLAAYSRSLTAKALQSQGRMAEAVAQAQEAARLAPDSASMQAGLGLTLMQAGRVQEGRQVNAAALRLALAVDPQSQAGLIQLLERPGMTAAAPR